MTKKFNDDFEKEYYKAHTYGIVLNPILNFSTNGKEYNIT
jgi:hypothetical protein